jgi:hypothetical protein
MNTKILVYTNFTNEAHSTIQHAVKLGLIVQNIVPVLCPNPLKSTIASDAF